ncbi:MAG: class I SAM-dependent rRNA methyltransferase [Acidobacteria bacterium]|nr:class I SAM-dependent rRNA methyltransferase [Acidobacteriota bacterium]
MSGRELIPRVTISARATERIRAGHVWVYRSDVVRARDVYPGALVRVERSSEGNERSPESRRFLGSAFYSASSQISLRMLAPHPVEDLSGLLRKRIESAVAYRQRFVAETNAYRVIFSEADGLPGWVVDRYNDMLSFEVLTQAADRGDLRELLVGELARAYQPASIVERVDRRVRRLEQLSEKPEGPVVGAKTSTEIQMNGVRFLIEALGGQKTGAFLDQRENYAAAAQYARGEALDVFCYQGGFSLHLAGGCDKVTGVDSSRPALEMAERNAALNGREIDWIEANAFDLLRDYSDAGRRYDLIVLDPPAFARSRASLESALAGYKELNLRALKMLTPGGILVTCSCSYHVRSSEFLEVISAAAQDAHRTVRVLETRGQARDHPSVLGIPETHYLKCVIAHVNLSK